MGFFPRATIVLCVFLLAGWSNEAPNPDVSLDIKVGVNGKEVIHATHPKGWIPGTFYSFFYAKRKTAF